MAIFLAILLIAFLGYMHFTGQKIPLDAQELKQSASKTMDQAVKSAKEEIANKVADKIREQ